MSICRAKSASRSMIKPAKTTYVDGEERERAHKIDKEPTHKMHAWHLHAAEMTSDSYVCT